MNVHYELINNTKVTTHEDLDDSIEATSEHQQTNRKLKLSKEGIIPKDVESKKEMMSFIAYAQNLEQTCKLLTYNKQVNYGDGSHDTNRSYVSGNAIMSIKLPVSKAISNDLCSQLQETEIHKCMVKKNNFLDKNTYVKCTNKMKNFL